VLVPGVTMRGVVGVGMVLMLFVMLVRDGGRMRQLHTVVNRRGVGGRGFDHRARRGIAERQRHTGGEHAGQVEQRDNPPCLGA
jgi:hypothetical protein